MLALMRPLPAPFEAIAAGRPATIDVSGAALLGSRLLTKGLAFPPEERDVFGLHGLLPERVLTIEEQCELEVEHLRARTTTWSAISGWPPSRTGMRPSSTGSSPSTWRSSCRSSTRRPLDGRARPSATSCDGRAGSGSRPRIATGFPSSCATVSTPTCG